MQEKESLREGDGEKKIRRIVILKTLLSALFRDLPEGGCETGVYFLRYRSGDADRILTFAPLSHDPPQKIADLIEKKFVTDHPVFNNRTPIIDGIRQFWEREIRHRSGPLSVFLFSDGEENFYDSNDDPLKEIRKMKAEYPEIMKDLQSQVCRSEKSSIKG